MDSFVKLLRAWKVHLNLPLRVLEERVGLHENSLQRYFNGKIPPQTDRLETIVTKGFKIGLMTFLAGPVKVDGVSEAVIPYGPPLRFVSNLDGDLERIDEGHFHEILLPHDDIIAVPVPDPSPHLRLKPGWLAMVDTRVTNPRSRQLVAWRGAEGIEFGEFVKRNKSTWVDRDDASMPADGLEFVGRVISALIPV